MAAVARVQRSVVVPKAKHNAFAKFSYRSYEDIVAALKEPCAKEGIAFCMTDQLERVGDRCYVRSTVRVFPAGGAARGRWRSRRGRARTSTRRARTTRR